MRTSGGSATAKVDGVDGWTVISNCEIFGLVGALQVQVDLGKTGGVGGLNRFAATSSCVWDMPKAVKSQSGLLVPISHWPAVATSW